MKRVQDPVHGLMEFRGMESFAIEALRAEEIQRLRRVRQLGLVYLVFPGAEHSRFAHSLGSAFLTARFARSLETATREFLPASLRADETIVRDLVLAALCHDLGHGPLSHPWEQQLIGENFDRARWAAAFGLPDRAWIREDIGWHELVTQGLLLWPDGELHKLLEALEEGTSERVAALVGGRFYLPYFARIFASDVDVDRCDFILRDAYQTGVAYGRYDVDWLVSTVTVGEADGRPVIGFDAVKAPRVVEQLLIARRALYDTVYHHPGVRSAEGMVGLLLARLKEHGSTTLDDIEGFTELKRAINGETLSLNEVLALDDHNLWVFIQRVAAHSKDKVSADLAARILDRDLFKPVPIMGDRLQHFMNENPPDAIELVDRTLDACGYTDPTSYRHYDPATFWFFHRHPEEGSMFIDTQDTRRTAAPLREHPELIHHPRDKQETMRLFVPADAVVAVADAMKSAGA
jgi:HD superfamily phosphohydrolase